MSLTVVSAISSWEFLIGGQRRRRTPVRRDACAASAGWRLPFGSRLAAPQVLRSHVVPTAAIHCLQKSRRAHYDRFSDGPTFNRAFDRASTDAYLLLAKLCHGESIFLNLYVGTSRDELKKHMPRRHWGAFLRSAGRVVNHDTVALLRARLSRR